MPRTIDVNFVNPFLQAVIDVLTTMAQVIPSPGKPFLKKNSYAQGDVTGIIGITGENKGSISLTFPTGCALAVVSAMVGEDIKELNEEIRDGVGELTNMVSGQARKGLAEQGMKFHASIPSVIIGPGHVVRHMANGPVLAIPFTTPYGDITVEVCLSLS